MNDARTLTERLKARALELGFQKVGVARAGSADPEGRLRAWLAKGGHAGMGYMAEGVAEREDATVLLPGAKSVVALMISYAPEAPEPVLAEARVARYARSDDYHGFLKRRVRKLRKFLIQLVPDAKVHPALDTSPVLERAWAARAGIAWIGKSTMAISRDLGTYTFLAALVTTAELEADPPHDDYCGSCTRCLTACPTQAFVAPRVLDARRCITYWTVEHVGGVPAGSPDPHGWLAGCDICQEVCPWNKFAQPTREPRLKPHPELTTPDLSMFADEASEERRRQVLDGTALQRTGSASLRRNALRILEERSRPPRS
ncbi:MAG: tRNA epoxyqueuosine(34) reductase QueG [Deltaproteobacteria bacterium]|nr:tRNA epoxyqueuosine(34) reductase QueG [Deltaproteobacteria bacterium]